MRALWLARLLAPRLRSWAQRRDPDFKVTDTNGDVYLKRWHIVKPRWWRPGLYLHQMLRDDDVALHDHPYASVSLVLSEGLRETYTANPQAAREDWDAVWDMIGHVKVAPFGLLPNDESRMLVQLRYPQPGDIIYRSSRFAHKLQVLPETDPWTLFFTGRRLKKEWGFWCPRGWRHFRQFNNVKPGQNNVGLGCGEMDP